MKKENLIIIRNSALFAAAGAIGCSIGSGTSIVICFIIFLPMFLIAYLLGFPWIRRNKLTILPPSGTRANKQEVQQSQVVPKPGTMLHDVQEVSQRLIVKGYRNYGAEHGCAPTSKISDQKITEIYNKFGTAFQQAAQKRGEHIPAGILNRIVLRCFWAYEFFHVYELDSSTQENFLTAHLHSEVHNYLAEGLRPDCTQELVLFDPDGNDPDVTKLHELMDIAVLGHKAL